MSDGEEYLDSALRALIKESEGIRWLNVEDLKEGDTLEVKTENSTYTMKIVEPASAHVLVTSDSEGIDLKEEHEAYVGGSSLTGRGTMMKVHCIGLELRLVLFIADIGEALLSYVREVKLNGDKIMM